MRLVKVVPDPLTPVSVSIEAGGEQTRNHGVNLGGGKNAVKQIAQIVQDFTFILTILKDMPVQVPDRCATRAPMLCHGTTPKDVSGPIRARRKSGLQWVIP